jgi:hypothetical protein
MLGQVAGALQDELQQRQIAAMVDGMVKAQFREAASVSAQ